MVFSSGTEAAMLIKDYKLGIIIGQETGGLASGYGDRFVFELPNTRIKVGVSYKWSLRPIGIDDNRGVIPDVILKPSLQNLLFDKDQEMEYMLNLIKKIYAPRTRYLPGLHHLPIFSLHDRLIYLSGV